MFKIVKNVLKEIVIIARDKNAIHIPSILFSYKHYKNGVNHNNYDVRQVTGAPKEIPCAFASLMTDNNRVIVVNDGYMNLPLQYRHAILLHETGHIELGHLDNVVNNPDNVDELKDEYEADDYSINHGGNMVGVFNHFLLNYPSFTASGGMLKRIERFIDLGHAIDIKAYKQVKLMSKIL